MSGLKAKQVHESKASCTKKARYLSGERRLHLASSRVGPSLHVAVQSTCRHFVRHWQMQSYSRRNTTCLACSWATTASSLQPLSVVQLLLREQSTRPSPWAARTRLAVPSKCHLPAATHRVKGVQDVKPCRSSLLGSQSHATGIIGLVPAIGRGNGVPTPHRTCQGGFGSCRCKAPRKGNT